MGTGLDSQFMLAIEDTPGVFKAPTHSLEFNQESLHETIDKLWSNGLTPGRRMRRRFLNGGGGVAGQTLHELTIENASILFRCALGDMDVTGASAPYTHTGTMGALPSVSAQVGVPGATVLPKSVYGLKVATWTLNNAVDEIPTLQLDWMGVGQTKAPALGTWTPPTELHGLSFVHAVLSIDGTELEIDSLSLTGNNALSATRKIRSVDPGRPTIREGADFRSVSGQAVCDFTNWDNYDRFVAGEGAAFEMVYADPIDGYTITITGKVEFDNAGADVSGPEIVKETLPFTFYHEDTDAEALTVAIETPLAAP